MNQIFTAIKIVKMFHCYFRYSPEIQIRFLFCFVLKVVKKETGNPLQGLPHDCSETMYRKRWDVQQFNGEHARVKLVDASSGRWGHINFDDLKGDISCKED